MSDTKIYLTRRGNGYYYLGVRLSDNRVQWKTTKCTRKSEALEFVRAFKSQAAEHKPAEVPTLLDFLPVFNQRVAGIIRPSTLSGYALTMKQFTNVVGNKPLSDYSLADIDRYKSLRLAKKNKPVTLNIEFRAIKSLFLKAEKWGIISSTPMRQIQQMKVPAQAPLFLTKEDFRELHNNTKDKTLKDLLLWSVLTGCRISVSLQIRWKDIDLTQRRIVIANSDLFNTKSGHDRTIPINDSLLPMLQRRFAIENRSELVFHKRGYPLNRVSITHKFKRLVRELKLNPDFKFHSLRHTSASWLVQSGVPLYTVSKVLGHSQISTTQIYSHLSHESIAAELNKIAV
jgi:integrase